ncbi:MAG TPA: hypothetical protein VJ863_11545 [Sphaerochaeta sp.]|nr:hypothetical protein [Sphaerochaeta sp.]
MEFMTSVRVEGNSEKAEELRTLLFAQNEREPETTIMKIRIDTTLARFYVETGSKNTDRGEALLREAEEKLGLLEKDQAFHALILGSEIDGIWYLQNPRSLGKGMSSSRKINKAFKAFPQEVSSHVLKANSMLYAPSFAGGDIRGALNMFLSILKDAEAFLSPWDRSSLYSGIGIACFKLKDYQNAKGYLAAAKAIYPFDAVLDDYIAQVENLL